MVRIGGHDGTLHEWLMVDIPMYLIKIGLALINQFIYHRAARAFANTL